MPDALCVVPRKGLLPGDVRSVSTGTVLPCLSTRPPDKTVAFLAVALIGANSDMVLPTRCLEELATGRALCDASAKLGVWRSPAEYFLNMAAAYGEAQVKKYGFCGPLVGFWRIPSRTSAIGTPLLNAAVASFSVGNLPPALDEEAILLLSLQVLRSMPFDVHRPQRQRAIRACIVL